MDAQTFLTPLYSVLVVFVGFTLVGLLCDLLSTLVMSLLSGLLGPVIYLGWSTLFLPGIIMHELSHAAFLALCGARINDIVVREDTEHPLTLYRRGDLEPAYNCATNRAGHVSYSRRGPYVIQSLQRVLGAIAPTVVGVVCMVVLYGFIVTYCTIWWQYVIFVYLFICALMGSAMSIVDIADMGPGLPVIMAILYVIFLITGFDAISYIPVQYLDALRAFVGL